MILDPAGGRELEQQIADDLIAAVLRTVGDSERELVTDVNALRILRRDREHRRREIWNEAAKSGVREPFGNRLRDPDAAKESLERQR